MSSGRYAPAWLPASASHRLDRSEHEIEKVQRVARHVDEETAAGARRVDAPRRRSRVGFLRRPLRLELAARHHPDRTDGAALHQIAHLEEARQRAAIEGDPQRDTGRAARGEHVAALTGIHRHRLLDQHRLARGRAAQHVIAMRVRRRRDVHGVDVVGADDRVGIVVPARNAVAPRVVGGQRAVPPHDRDQLRIRRLLETGSALDLGDVTAADDAPANRLHCCARRPRSALMRPPAARPPPRHRGRRPSPSPRCPPPRSRAWPRSRDCAGPGAAPPCAASRRSRRT